jgi:hypothetical protein
MIQSEKGKDAKHGACAIMAQLANDGNASLIKVSTSCMFSCMDIPYMIDMHGPW